MHIVKPCPYKRCIQSILQLPVQTKRLFEKIDGLRLFVSRTIFMLVLITNFSTICQEFQISCYVGRVEASRTCNPEVLGSKHAGCFAQRNKF